MFVKDVNLGAERYVEMVTAILLPRLQDIKRAVWDTQANGAAYKIRIQDDGAQGHRAECIEAKLESAFASINGEFVRQPPKNPDSNMLDMAVFNSMAHLVARCDCRTKTQLRSAVMQAWYDLLLDTLNMQCACKSVCMRQYIPFLGNLTPSPAKHNGLTAAFTKGGLKALAERVDYICSSKYKFKI